MDPQVSPREKPLVLYDGDCILCQRQVDRWRRLTGHRVEYIPFQQVEGQFPGISHEQFQASLQMVDSDGKVTQGAAAVFRLLAHVPSLRWMLWIYRKVPGAAYLTEWGYRFIARHRGRF